MEADGLVAVEIHAHIVLGWTAALLNDKGIRAGDSLTKVNVSKELPGGMLPKCMWPCQQRVVVHDYPLPVHFYLQLVVDSIEELLERPEVLRLASVWVMIPSYQDDLAMQQDFQMLYGGKAATLVAEIAQMEHDGIFRHCCVPVLDQCLVMLCYRRPWTVTEAGDVLMAEVRVTGEEHHAAIFILIFHNLIPLSL